MSKPPGWRNEPARHALAARGVRSGYVPPKYRKEGYEVYLNGVYQGFTKDLEEAKEYADLMGGRVVASKNRKKILYSARGIKPQKLSDSRYMVNINGISHDFGEDRKKAEMMARKLNTVVIYSSDDLKFGYWPEDPDVVRRRKIERDSSIREQILHEEAWKPWRRGP